MRVQGVAQILHDVLADPVVDVGLPQTEESRDDRGHDHHDHDEQEVAQSLRGGLVPQEDLEGDFDHQRVDQAQARYHQDQDCDEGDAPLVGLERPDDAAKRAGPRRPLRERRRRESMGAGH
jgi:hypothetical protein